MNLSKIAVKKKAEFISVSSRFGIVFIVAFGSRVSGTARAESDLDLAILTKKKVTAHEFFELTSRLQDILAGCNVHLNLLNETDILFKHKVITEGKLIFGDPKIFSQYRLITHKIYLTDLPKLTRYYDNILAANQKMLRRSIYGR